MRLQRIQSGWRVGLLLAGSGLLVAGWTVPTLGATIQQRPDDRYVAFEAESFAVSQTAATGRDFDEYSDPDASGDAAMLNDDSALDEDGTSYSKIYYRINFSQAGNYDLYHRSRQGSSEEGFATDDGNDRYSVYNDLVPDDGNDDFAADFDGGEFNSVQANGTSYEYLHTQHDGKHASEEGTFGRNNNDYSIDAPGTYEFAVRGRDDGLLLDRLIFTRNGEGLAGGPRFNFDEVPNSPIPEPASLAVLGIGAGMTLLPRRRRKASARPAARR